MHRMCQLPHPLRCPTPQVSQEQEAEIQARLQVRRGVGRRQSDSRAPNEPAEQSGGRLRPRRME